MKFMILSDIHDDFNYNMKGDYKDVILLLAGDVGEVKRKTNYKHIIDKFCSIFHSVVLITGNHEYYKYNIKSVHNFLESLDNTIDNFYFLNDSVLELDGDINIIGSTLWTSINNYNPIDVSLCHKLNDYHCIRIGSQYRKLKPNDTFGMHNVSVDFIKNTLEKYKDKKNIIMTHHAPSHVSIPEKYISDNLNSYYYTDLSELILDYEPMMWVHGHIHEPVDYQIGNTRVCSNPIGYSDERKGLPPAELLICIDK